MFLFQSLMHETHSHDLLQAKPSLQLVSFAAVAITVKAICPEV